MAELKNIHLLGDSINSKELEMMEQAALMHRRHSAISFKIIDWEPEKVVIQISQSKSSSGNYFDLKRLIEIVHETYDRFFPNKIVMVHPIPYKESKADIVTVKWINDKMLTTGTKLKDIIDDTGLNKSQLSAIINGIKPLSQPMKALFYYYFLSKKRS